jgi:hypothetical protein
MVFLRLNRVIVNVFTHNHNIKRLLLFPPAHAAVATETRDKTVKMSSPAIFFPSPALSSRACSRVPGRGGSREGIRSDGRRGPRDPESGPAGD